MGGTTGQIEEAHRALDELNVKPGPLAVRVIMLIKTREWYNKKVGGTNEN